MTFRGHYEDRYCQSQFGFTGRYRVWQEFSQTLASSFHGALQEVAAQSGVWGWVGVPIRSIAKLLEEPFAVDGVWRTQAIK